MADLSRTTSSEAFVGRRVTLSAGFEPRGLYGCLMRYSRPPCPRASSVNSCFVSWPSSESLSFSRPKARSSASASRESEPLQGDGAQACPSLREDFSEPRFRNEDGAGVRSVSRRAARVEPAAPDPVGVGGGQPPAVVARDGFPEEVFRTGGTFLGVSAVEDVGVRVVTGGSGPWVVHETPGATVVLRGR